MIEIQLNGSRTEVADSSTIADLVSSMGLEGKRFAVELNKEIVPKTEHSGCYLKAGDTVEVVQAIGGG